MELVVLAIRLVIHVIELELHVIEPECHEIEPERHELFAYDELIGATWDQIKWVRTGEKSVFGDNRSEYEVVGGTRMRDCKSPTRQEEPAA